MKLLFDNQISPRLVSRLSDLFPDSDHVYPLHLDRADDTDIPLAILNCQRRLFRDGLREGLKSGPLRHVPHHAYRVIGGEEERHLWIGQ